MKKERADWQLYYLARQHIGVDLTKAERAKLVEQIEKLSGDVFECFEDAKFGSDSEYVRRHADDYMSAKFTAFKVDVLMAIGAEDRGSRDDQRLIDQLNQSHHQVRFGISREG